MGRFQLLNVYLLLALGTGCVNCWFAAQPDCVGTHSIDLQDSDGMYLRDFNGQIRVPDQDLVIDVQCRTDTYTTTVHYACGTKGLKIRHFEHPVLISVATVDGSQMAEESFELTIGTAPDACSCDEFKTHTMVLQ